MPANTPNSALPYPLPTEPVAEGASAIQALAEALDPLVRAPITNNTFLRATSGAAWWQIISWYDVANGIGAVDGQQFTVKYDGTYIMLQFDGVTRAWIPLNFDPGSGWMPYSPALTASNVNPNLGTGFTSGRYQRIGSTIHARAKVHFGPGGSVGDGEYYISLPLNGIVGNERGIGTFWARHGADVQGVTGMARMVNATNVGLYYSGQSIWAWTPAWNDGSDGNEFEIAVTYDI